MSALLVILWSHGSGWAQSAGCPADPMAEVERARLALWEAFRTVDDIAFDRASKSMVAGIGCLDRVPAPAEIVRLHQAMALAAYVNGQIKATKRSFNSVRLMDPAWRLDDELFPGEHPMRDLFDAAIDPGPVANLGKINPKQWVVDGIERGEAPTERGFLLQVLGEDGRILWSGYQWDWSELPDFGQAQARSALETPHQWWISGTLFGGALSTRQREAKLEGTGGADTGTATEVGPISPPVDDDFNEWQDQSGTAFMAGARLTVRYTPITVLGGEIAASIASPADPVKGGGGLPSGHALVLLGGAGWAGQLQPFAQVRLGFGLDRMRNWYSADAEGDAISPRIYTIPSAIAGVGGGIRNERYQLALAVDGKLQAARVPYQLRTRLDGGVQLTELLAVEGALEVGGGGLEFHNVPDDLEKEAIGRRSDVDFRLGGGISIWY